MAEHRDRCDPRVRSVVNECMELLVNRGRGLELPEESVDIVTNLLQQLPTPALVEEGAFELCVVAEFLVDKCSAEVGAAQFREIGHAVASANRQKREKKLKDGARFLGSPPVTQPTEKPSRPQMLHPQSLQRLVKPK
ncbi:MAG: hypothetical protein A2289_19055 [Deltaproteobacteria bacterium RIFOXYA12_FULL_58_15]|nr:MAG: hypothetical protein A2289_19055 [Deltaproteobacteria bacterium RIFOXYA12_FULL_58_15]OGR08508.1 MAG: hypothetical protein A2341_03000 [Deltaproteobacteria bacterium RIFOXYB12_FULL_58_9]